MCILSVGFVVSVLSLVVLLSVALQPQASWFSPGGDWWGWLLALLAVFLEAALAAFLILRVVVTKAQHKLFVKVVKAEGCWGEGWSEPEIGVDLFPGFATVFKVCTLPLNLLPGLGSAIYVALNSPLAAWGLMGMYYDCLGLDQPTQKVIVFGEGWSKFNAGNSTMNSHARFGFPAVLLELVPVLGPTVFTLGNAVGAALWACELERGRKATGGLTFSDAA